MAPQFSSKSMALLLFRKNHSFSRLRPIFASQRCSHTLLKKRFDSEVESIDPVAQKSYVLDLSKWRKVRGYSWQIPPSPEKVVKILQKKGYEAYLVGGCVRDLLLNRVPKDFDIITSATLKQIKGLFNRALIVGQRFPICIVWLDNLQVEVSSFNTISQHAEEKDEVLLSCMTYDCDKKDFMRWRNSMHRDFTINSLFFDPSEKCIYDYANGMRDLKSLKLRTVVPAHSSFQEDRARILRGIRIAARLGLSISRDTATAMRELSSSLRELDRRRTMLELNYMLSYGAAGSTISLLRRFKLFDLFFPFHAAYMKRQSRKRSTSSMLMKLFFFLDKSVTCDRPCHPVLWTGLLAFHIALVINPQDCLTIKTFASALYHGNWNRGVKFASENQVQVDFVPEISGYSDFKSNQELAEKVSQLASFAKNAINSLVHEGSLLKSMSKYTSSPCSGLVFVSETVGRRVAGLFDVLVDDIESYKDNRRNFEIDYAYLRKGDLRETQFVLGKIILETLGVELVQKNVVKLEDVEKTRDSMAKHHLLTKNDVKSILFSELKKEMAKKQESVKVNDLSQEIMKRKELALKDMSKEAVKQNPELMGTSHSPGENLNLPHKSMAKDAVKDNSAKPKGTSIQKKLFDGAKHHTEKNQKQTLKTRIQFVENNHTSQQEMDVNEDNFASRNRCKEAFGRSLNTNSSHIPAEKLMDKILKKFEPSKISDGFQHSIVEKMQVVGNNHTSQQEMDVNEESRNRCKEAFGRSLNTNSSHLPAEDLMDKILEKFMPSKISDGFQHKIEDKSEKLKETSTNGKGSQFPLSSLFR